MTMDDFLKITKGINGGKDLDRDFIINIYETVEKEPLRMRMQD
jgi:Sec7-like guanine-nucleotide exchange factor